jgi:hypothetical protein
MGSQLANILIRAHAETSAHGDVIWRNTDLDSIEFIGIIPGKDLIAELIEFRGPSAAGEKLGRLTPGRENIDLLVTSTHPSVRAGAAANRNTTREHLAVLAADTSTEVAAKAAAELTERDRLRQACSTGEFQPAREILRLGRREEVAWLLEQQPDLLAAATVVEDDAAEKIRLLEPELFESIAVSVIEAGHTIGATVGRWMTSDGDLAQAFAAEAAKRQKTPSKFILTDEAEHLLVKAGHLSRKGAVEPRKIHVRLEDMALALEPAETAAIYFSTAEKVDPDLVEEILQEAPVTLLVNHLIGQTPRRPRPGQVTEMLRKADPQRRNAVSDALEELISKAEHTVDAGNPIQGLPWGGELSLALKRVRAHALSEQEASSLLREIEAVIGENELAWEYLLALSEEWEGALIELVVSAAHMENITV